MRATNWLASLRTDSDGEVRTEQQPSALMQQALRRLKRGGHIEADADLAVACIIAPNKRKPAALAMQTLRAMIKRRWVLPMPERQGDKVALQRYKLNPRHA